MKARCFILIALSLVAVVGMAGYAAAASVAQPAGMSAATATSTALPTIAVVAAATGSDRASSPTQDVISMLVTKAYQRATPAARATQLPRSTPAAIWSIPSSIARLLTPTATLDPAPALVIFGEPTLIPNAVSTADCKIRNVGDCTPRMQAGVTLFFTWTFGVRSAETFNWGQAAVVITRDGHPVSWTLTGNGLVLVPANDQSWTLRAGQSAKFAAGLENAQRGYYEARLLMCMLSPEECSAGQGWQNVGGEAIHFVVGS